MGVRVAAAPLALDLLTFFDDWRNLTEIVAAFPAETPKALAAAVADLVRHSLVDVRREGRSIEARDSWESWDPAAGFLHFSAKDPRFIEPDLVQRRLRARAARTPMPTIGKRYPAAVQISLPSVPRDGEFPRTLLARRTWRRFGPRGVTFGALSALLGLSAGVQHWIDRPRIGRLPFTSYPSGGAQHPLELYVLVRRVRGLAAGMYHYAADAHRLERLRRGATSAQIRRYLPTQDWYGSASALLLITAVFERTQWKYRAPRGYRTVIAEAGHLCQNICLTATWLGLAPFCTMALADSKIEKDLGIDGVTEALVYAAGVGARPDKVDWAPWPTGKRVRKIPGPLGN